MNTKILFCASYPNQPIGYSRIANVLSNFLASQSQIELYYFGFSNFEHLQVDRFINPNIKFIDVFKEEKLSEENFGTTIINQVVEQIQPNMIFIYNDIIVTCRLFNSLQTCQFKNYKLVVYIDLVYKFEKPLYIDYLKRKADQLFVFSDYWKHHLVNDFKFEKDKVFVLPHGLNKEHFFIIDKLQARKQLNFEEDDFIVFNTNRNTYRKGWDITISSFLQFYKMTNLDKKVKLLINCKLESKSGYDIIELVKIYCIKYNLDYNHIINNQIILLKWNFKDPKNGSTEIPDHFINLVYNAVDVGLNTCVGEGFGLCNLEGACLNVPQVVSNVGGLSDMFENELSMLVDPITSIQCSNLQDGHNGDLEICNSQDFAKRLYMYYLNSEKRTQDGLRIGTKLRNKYDWNNILDTFLNQLAI